MLETLIKIVVDPVRPRERRNEMVRNLILLVHALLHFECARLASAAQNYILGIFVSQRLFLASSNWARSML